MKRKNKFTPKCPYCNGTGESPSKLSKSRAPRFKCQECNGSGERKNFEMMFWKYDQFPYVLSAPGFLEDNGTAYVPSYASHFRPIIILSLSEGVELKTKLDALEHERAAAIRTLHEGFRSRLEAVCPRALKP